MDCSATVGQSVLLLNTHHRYGLMSQLPRSYSDSKSDQSNEKARAARIRYESENKKSRRVLVANIKGRNKSTGKVATTNVSSQN